MKLLNRSKTARWGFAVFASLLLEWSVLSHIEAWLLMSDLFIGTPGYIVGYVAPKLAYWTLTGATFVLLVDRSPSAIYRYGSAAIIGGYYIINDFILRSWQVINIEGFIFLTTPYVLALVGYLFALAASSGLLEQNSKASKQA